MDFKFQRKRIDKFTESKILNELERAAEHFQYIEFSKRNFTKFTGMSITPIQNQYGSWKNGLAALRNHLQQKGLDLSPRPYAPQRIYSDKDLFEEMGRIWQKVGQRPSKTEWEAAEPKISITAYKKRFGSWTIACQRFFEYQMGQEISSDNFVRFNREDNNQQPDGQNQRPKEYSRNISLRLRLKVLNRDNFKCVFCGKSPATDFGTKLHIDHIIPFSKGGTSTLDNLQTLCEDCNLGKSDMRI